MLSQSIKSLGKTVFPIEINKKTQYKYKPLFKENENKIKHGLLKITDISS